MTLVRGLPSIAFMISAPSFALPETVKNSANEERRVGVEIEYAGPSLEEVAQDIVRLFGGTWTQKNPFQYHVTGTRFGDFRVESDSSLLRDQRYESFLDSIGLSTDDRVVRDLLAKLGINVSTNPVREAIDEAISEISSLIVPYEVVTPPIPVSQLSELDLLCRTMRRRGAEGTNASVLNAFGLHLNPEIPRLSLAWLLGPVRASILLHDWMVWIGDIDVTRRLSPFIHRYPEIYRDLVLDPAYQPDLGQFIDDYLAHNPTRNRALDLLPVLATRDLERVKRSVEEPDLVSARPALHYRLPNSMIDDGDWSLAVEWNRWVTIEKLAMSSRLLSMCEDYRATFRQPFAALQQVWLKRTARWLEALEI